MANPEHLAKLREGVEAWNAWRKENKDVDTYRREKQKKRMHPNL